MFWEQLERFDKKVALIEGEQRLSYAELASRCDKLVKQLGSGKRLVLVLASNNIVGVIAYLACLRGGHTMMMIDPSIDASKKVQLIEAYSPNFLIEDEHVEGLSEQACHLDERLALLLSTSGSTGSAKQVALSFNNIQSNADSICEYLPIRDSDCALSTLPLFYSYGLSVINTHLNRGAAIVFTQYSMMNREFWDLFEREKITSIAGVPHSYDMLLMLRFTQKNLPYLRYFTQAGGKLSEDKVKILADYAAKSDKAFFVMYGQTEATARMAFLEPSMVSNHSGSIGQAIPGGQFYLCDDNGNQIDSPNVVGEIFYTGPNVMLGYVNGRSDLHDFAAKESLATGDLGFRDEQGLMYITGRKKRFVKLFGNRISLDEVEHYFSQKGIDAMCTGNDNKLVVALKNVNTINDMKRELSTSLAIHSSAIEIFSIDEFPINANGKKDYSSLLGKVG